MAVTFMAYTGDTNITPFAFKHLLFQSLPVVFKRASILSMTYTQTHP